MSLSKVLLITYYWPPSGGAGVQRSLKFVRYFRDFGIEPIVITVNPEKASYPVLDPSLKADIPAGIKVYTTASFEPLNILSGIAGKKNVPYGGFANANKESRTQTLLRWVRGNFFIPDARVGWVRYAVKEAIRIIEKEGIKTVLISSPPHSSQLIGLKLKKRFPDLCWVADLRDPWTDIYYYKDLLHTAAAASLDKKYERQVLEQADAVVVVSEPIRQQFLTKSDKINPTAIHVIPNGYDEEDFKEDIQPDPDYFTISYVGTMADSYEPMSFFKALKELTRQAGKRKLRFRFVGTTPWTLKQKTEDLGLSECVEWKGLVSHREAIHYMKSSDVLLLLIPVIEGAEGILTGKLFEYLGSGRPILGLGPANGAAAAIINECEAGKMFEREQEGEMGEWLRKRLVSDESSLSIDRIERRLKYSRRNLAGQMTEIINANSN